MEILHVLNYFFILIALIYIYNVFTFVIGWCKLLPFQYQPSTAQTKVSIIIAARNEEDNIGRTLDHILAQDYDHSLLEVIVVDDHSTDATSGIVSSYSKFGVKLIKLNESAALNSYKKKAVQTAIGQSEGKLIITTDADCSMGPNWLKTVVSYYELNDYKMISSPVTYFEEKNMFERIQTLEFAYLVGLGAAKIGNKTPATCNGANLAYEREAFFEVGGFKGIDELASGDDEMLMHKMAAHYKDKVGFLKNRDAIVFTYAKANLHELIQQRKRWASKTTKYQDKSFTYLSISVWLFSVCILLNVLFAFIFPGNGFTALLLFQLGVKIVMEFIFTGMIIKFFNRTELLILGPIVSVLHNFYMVYIGIVGNTGKYEWKNRMVR